MTPWRMTTKRSAVMPISRTSTTTVTHQGSSPSSDSPTSAVPVSALSAIGSAILPKSVTSPRLRASSPSTRSVTTATAKIANAATRQRVVLAAVAEQQPGQKTGTSSSRSTVSALATFQALADAPCPEARRQRTGAGSRCADTASRAGAAIRSAPSLPITRAAHDVADPGSCAGHGRRPVHLGALVRGAALCQAAVDATRPAPRRSSPTRSSARCAVSSSTSALTRPTRSRDLVRRELRRRSPPPRCRPRRSIRRRRPRPAAPAPRKRLELGEVVLGLAREPDDDVGADTRRGRSDRGSARAGRGRTRRRRTGASGAARCPLACWKDRSKYGATPGVDVITSTRDGRISAGCR